MKPTTFAPVSVRSRKIERSTSGCAVRRSIPRNSASKSADAPKSAIVVNENQWFSLVLTSV